MSVEKRYVMVCDECGNEDSCDETNKKNARRVMKPKGWCVGLKATAHRPSTLDTKVDYCPSCWTRGEP